ncbi:MAG TPA: carbohydrate binding domain-containing protein [Kiritimatiellia bacterium]
MNRKRENLVACGAGFLVAVVQLAGAAQVATGGVGKDVALNGGFEQMDTESAKPVGWTPYMAEEKLVSVTPGVARSGRMSAMLTAQGAPNSNLGLFQEQDVKPGDTYAFSAFVIENKDNELDGVATGVLTIEWKDDAGNEVSRDASDTWSKLLLSKSQWRRVEVTGTAPAGAAKARFVVTLFEGDQPGKGSFCVDDVQITAKVAAP